MTSAILLVNAASKSRKSFVNIQLLQLDIFYFMLLYIFHTHKKKNTNWQDVSFSRCLPQIRSQNACNYLGTCHPVIARWTTKSLELAGQLAYLWKLRANERPCHRVRRKCRRAKSDVVLWPSQTNTCACTHLCTPSASSQNLPSRLGQVACCIVADTRFCEPCGQYVAVFQWIHFD